MYTMNSAHVLAVISSMTCNVFPILFEYCLGSSRPVWDFKIKDTNGGGIEQNMARY